MQLHLVSCSGLVGSLRGQTVALTGKVFVDGEHIKRDELAKRLRMYGAGYKTVLTGQISLVVHGDLSGQIVSNMRSQLSRKLIDIMSQERLGHHVCGVTSEGFSALLKGSPAKCFHDELIDRVTPV
jgi:BRCT domain type II-containing protein